MIAELVPPAQDTCPAMPELPLRVDRAVRSRRVATPSPHAAFRSPVFPTWRIKDSGICPGRRKNHIGRSPSTPAIFNRGAKSTWSTPGGNFSEQKSSIQENCGAKFVLQQRCQNHALRRSEADAHIRQLLRIDVRSCAEVLDRATQIIELLANQLVGQRPGLDPVSLVCALIDRIHYRSTALYDVVEELHVTECVAVRDIEDTCTGEKQHSFIRRANILGRYRYAVTRSPP